MAQDDRQTKRAHLKWKVNGPMAMALIDVTEQVGAHACLDSRRANKAKTDCLKNVPTLSCGVHPMEPDAKGIFLSNQLEQ